MTQSLSKSAKSLQNALKSNGLECKVKELINNARTSQDVAKSIGCSIGQIVKSLIFKIETTCEPVLVLASGLNHVNERVIEFEVGGKIVKADARFTKDVTGYVVGGIPPIGHKQKINYIFIDEDLMKYSSLWAAAGAPEAMFNLQPRDLCKITQGKIINLNVIKK